jgi:hypothetical protein
VGASCTANGPILYPLPTLTADGDGDALAAISIPTAAVPTTGWYVNVHLGPGLMGKQATPIGCGPVRPTM